MVRMAFLRQTDTAQQIQLTAVVGDPKNLIVSLSIDRSFVRSLDACGSVNGGGHLRLCVCNSSRAERSMIIVLF